MRVKKCIKIGLLLSVIITINSDLFSQLKKANSSFEQGNYSEAIYYYSKVIKKDSTNIDATQNIAFAYRKLKDYTNSEVYYAKATKMNPSESANFFYYGQTLKNNNKVKEAKKQFLKFADKNPKNLMAKLMVQSCNDIGKWATEEKEFKVSTIENINTKNADFCPLVYKDGIVFVSEREKDLVNENNFGTSNKPYLSIFYASKDKKYKKAKYFSSQLNSLYHDGPVSISVDNKTIFFTRVDKQEKGKAFTNNLKIYYAKSNGYKWDGITEFSHNNINYSVGHPWISEDNKRLFFASDMPGGYGGMDIYVSTKRGEEWGEPVNLGEGVNTSKNDVFPYFRKGILYFSSDGHSGYGGLDIYSVKETDNWKNSKNLKAPINSPKDDFGIFYKDDESGYFSSDRTGGLGSDDIYSFTSQTLVPQTEMSGFLEYKGMPAPGAKINLIDENNTIVSSNVTDEKGMFKFKKLKGDKHYLIAIDSEDDDFLDKALVYITNSKQEKVQLASRASKGRFEFKALPYFYYNGLEPLEIEDESLFTVEIFGQIYKKLPGDYQEGMILLMLDDEGNVVGKTLVDKKGKFKFRKLKPDEHYFFKLSEDDSELNIVIFDENGNVMESAKRLLSGNYKYVRLKSDKKVLTLLNEVDDVIKIAENENFIISKILYEFASAEINETAASELNKIVLILQKNKNIGIELSSHTDSKGTEKQNMILSQKRADIAVKYVLSKGVKSTKVKAKGYGETIPVAPNELPNGEDNPEGRAKNRRTEFKVVMLK